LHHLPPQQPRAKATNDKPRPKDPDMIIINMVIDIFTPQATWVHIPKTFPKLLLLDLRGLYVPNEILKLFLHPTV
jgi:hypothetical protein